MKTTIIALSLLLISGMCSAHYLTPGCMDNSGRFKFFASQFPVGKTCTIKIISGGAAWDTSFKVTSSSFTFTIPQPNPTQPRQIRVKTNDGWEQTYWSTITTCTTLPLKFGAFKVEDIGDKVVKVSLTTYDETNMDRINITMSRDGLTFKIVLVLQPNNRSTEYTYTGTIDLKREQF